MLTTGHAVQLRSSRIFGPSIRQGPGRRKSIALTFDDGPSPGTATLVDYLQAQNVRATFFQCGENVVRHPAIARAVHLAGHEIGNHTFSHARLCPRLSWSPNLLSRHIIYNEFARTQKVLENEVGISPRLLRAPYGLCWFGMRAVQRQLRLESILWTVIGLDWILPASDISDRVLQSVNPAGIVCLHDGRDTRPYPDISETIAAVRKIVPLLLDKGYVFETVSDLLRPDPPPTSAAVLPFSTVN